jgi:histidinol-phosphate aminotransferase
LPYNVSEVAQKVAYQALKNPGKAKSYVAEILEDRGALVKSLESMAFIKKVYPTDSNQVLIKLDNPVELYKYLIKKGIVVRDRSKVPLCEGCLRVTVGTKKENEVLLEAMMSF